MTARNHTIDEFGEPLRKPRLAAGGAGGGDGTDLELVCMCGCGKVVEFTDGPSLQNIFAIIYNQLPKNVRTIMPFGQVPICEVHRWR